MRGKQFLFLNLLESSAESTSSRIGLKAHSPVGVCVDVGADP